MDTLLKRLHVVIPAEIFNEIYRNNDMERIDNLITELLCEYYGMQLTINGKRK